MYETVSTGQGRTFSVATSDVGAEYIDMFSCQQGRIVCNAVVEGADMQCAYPIYLEARPYFRGYKIHNVVEADANYYTFDVDLDYAGATGGYAAVCDNYGSCVNCGLAPTIHSPRVYKYGPAMIELYLTNSYGTTARALYVGTYGELTTSCALRISVKKEPNDFKIVARRGKLSIESNGGITKVLLADLRGIVCVQSVPVKKEFIDISNVAKGAYILTILKRNGEKLSELITIN